MIDAELSILPKTSLKESVEKEQKTETLKKYTE